MGNYADNNQAALMDPNAMRARMQKQQAFAKAGIPTPPDLRGTGGLHQEAPTDLNALMASVLGDTGAQHVGAGGDAAVGGQSALPSGDPSVNQMDDNADFGTAFATARQGGMPIFTWRGKEYTTEMADDSGGSVDGNAADAISEQGPKKGQPKKLAKGQAGSTPKMAKGQAQQAIEGGGDAPTNPDDKGWFDDLMNSIMGDVGTGLGKGAAVAAGGGGLLAGGAYAANKGKQANAAAPAGQATASTRASAKGAASYSSQERQAYKLIKNGDMAGAQAIAKKMQSLDPAAAKQIMSVMKQARGATGIPKGVASMLKALGL